jgi:hypothetical protein
MEALENLPLAVMLDELSGNLAAEVIDGAAALEAVVLHGLHAP